MYSTGLGINSNQAKVCKSLSKFMHAGFPECSNTIELYKWYSGNASATRHCACTYQKLCSSFVLWPLYLLLGSKVEGGADCLGLSDQAWTVLCVWDCASFSLTLQALLNYVFAALGGHPYAQLAMVSSAWLVYRRRGFLSASKTCTLYRL